MKKYNMCILTILALIIFTYSVAGIHEQSCGDELCNCHNPTTLNPDGDENVHLSLTDAIFLLNYLFSSGKQPLCIESADSNSDNKIDITDAIVILKYLFQGGKVPSGMYSEGTDDPPKLKLYYENQEERQKNLPATLFLMDETMEKDIVKCEIISYPIDETREIIGGGISVIDTKWEFPDYPLKGNDITTRPLEFTIDASNVYYNNDYLIKAYCSDRKGQTGEAELIVKIGNNENQDTCPDNEAITCRKYFENGEYEHYCVPLDQGNAECDEENGEFLVDNDCFPNDADICTCDPDFAPSYCSEEREGGGGADLYSCFVKSMNIIRNAKDAIPQGFELPKLFIEEERQNEDSPLIEVDGINSHPYIYLSRDENNNFNIPLGKTEGWMENYDYRAGYGFLVVATLEEDSNPSLCPEGQFAQLTNIFKNYVSDTSDYSGMAAGSILSGIIEFEFSRTISSGEVGQPAGMNVERDIITKDLNELNNKEANNIFEFGEDIAFPLSGEYFDGSDIELNGPPSVIEPAWRQLFCFTKSSTWCADDYLKPRTYNGISGDIKKHIEGDSTNLPKIIWYDLPSNQIPFIHLIDIESTPSGYIPIVGPTIPERASTERTSDFISIVEDSEFRQRGNELVKYRFMCRLSDWKMINKHNPATTERVEQIEPNCECIRQKRTPESDWETDDEFEKLIC